MSKEQKQSWNLLEPRSFDVCRNATALIIMMLYYSEVDIEVSDTSIETVESNNCREVLEDNRDANRILAMI